MKLRVISLPECKYSVWTGMRRALPQIASCSELTFSFVAVVADAVVASSFSGAVIAWETVSEESGFPSCGLGS